MASDVSGIECLIRKKSGAPPLCPEKLTEKYFSNHLVMEEHEITYIKNRQ